MKLALCCGLNYPGTEAELFGCVNDANDISTALVARGFEVVKLLDGAATREAILNELRGMINRCEYGDLVVFTFSGHGSWQYDTNGDEPDGKDEVLCPADTFAGQVIVDDDLAQVFAERERGVRIVFLSDSCHSGSVSRFSRVLPPPPAASRVRFLPPAAFLPERAIMDVSGIGSTRRALLPPGRTASLLISGCHDSEFSWDATFNGRANGAFSYAALRALERLPSTATYRDWHREIRKELPSAAHPQSPQLYGPRYQALRPALAEGR